MVGAHPSMPDTFDGYRILAQAEMKGVRKREEHSEIQKEYLSIETSRFKMNGTNIPCAAILTDGKL